jgi:hypothetical protein
MKPSPSEELLLPGAADDRVSSTALHQGSPPKAHDKVYLGLALVDQDIQLAVRTGEREIAEGSFPSGPVGIAALLVYLTDWQVPLRLAVAGVGAATLTLALAVGAQGNREVYLVAAHTPPVVSDLARYAQRAI